MKKENSLQNIGLTLNIVLSIPAIFFGLYALIRVTFFETYCPSEPQLWCAWAGDIAMYSGFLLIVTALCFVLPAMTIIYSIKAKTNKQFIRPAAIFGIITTIIGGALVIVSEYKEGDSSFNIHRERNYNRAASRLTLVGCIIAFILGTVAIFAVLWVFISPGSGAVAGDLFVIAVIIIVMWLVLIVTTAYYAAITICEMKIMNNLKIR